MRAVVAHAKAKTGEDIRGIAILVRSVREEDVTGTYERVAWIIDKDGIAFTGEALASVSTFGECGCFEFMP